MHPHKPHRIPFCLDFGVFGRLGIILYKRKGTRKSVASLLARAKLGKVDSGQSGSVTDSANHPWLLLLPLVLIPVCACMHVGWQEVGETALASTRRNPLTALVIDHRETIDRNQN